MGTSGASFDSGRKKSSNDAKRERRIKAAAVVAAGGAGIRMNSGIPKQFLPIMEKPVLLRTVENLAGIEEVTHIIVALPPEHISTATAMLQSITRVEVQCVAGGVNRQDSVQRGVVHVHPDTDVIMVHDAVRPFCDRDMIMRVLDAAWKKGAAVPGLPATDTIQRISRTGRILATPPREELFAIQTPQAFHADILRSSLDRAMKEGFLGTDESSIVRWAGYPVMMVPGSPDNIKITRPLDLEIAELLLSKRQNRSDEKVGEPRLRIGQGIDYHRLVEGRKFILGGVEIPFEKGLEGHSDADALLHAICDALLGAAALGDIGKHFPDTDPAHHGRSSIEFLREVHSKIEVEGWTIQNIDATLLVQRPRLAPHMQAMRENIADSLGLRIDEVSIKATTTEGMNAEGRGEGVSAQAIALLSRK
jgi:2-C-methyl-D-erythritol 4-phosphate cytidylyltransferase / 2-C-methyl-D-erythritol 2,4-cyclodiphosphate synthase